MSSLHGEQAGALRAMAAGTLALVLVACGGTSGDAASTAPAAAGGGKLDACKLLAAANPAEVLGEPVDSGKILWEGQTGEMAVSQCQFSATGSDRSVGLMVRRAPDTKAPASREAFIEATRQDDTMGAGEDTARALEAGKQVPGLGEMALTYNLFSFNLMVWKGTHQFTVMLDGFDADEVEQQAIRVAKSILARL